MASPSGLFPPARLLRALTPAYCTITVIGAPCEIPPDVAVIVRFTFPRTTPLVLPQPANPNTPTIIAAASTIANRALRIHSKEMSRLPARCNQKQRHKQNAKGERIHKESLHRPALG